MRMQHDPITLATRCIAVLTGIGSNVAAWAMSVNVGAVVSAITIVGSAVVYLIVLSIEKIGTARRKDERERAEQEIELAKLREAAMKGSLAAQITQVNDSLAKLRKTNHDIRDQLQSATNRNDELQDQLTEANRQLALANRQIIHLTEEIEKLRLGQRRSAQELKQAIDDTRAEVRADHDSRNELPAVKEPAGVPAKNSTPPPGPSEAGPC